MREILNYLADKLIHAGGGKPLKKIPFSKTENLISKTENLILLIITCKSQKFFSSQTGLLQNSSESPPWYDFPFWSFFETDRP
jgi:hypothetical protein